jgi:capsule assembly protein Wzi
MTFSTNGALSGAALALLGAFAPLAAVAGDALPFLPPGDAWLRHLVQIEADEGRVPLATTWPIPTFDVPADGSNIVYSALQLGSSTDAGWFVAGAAKPTQIRTFDDTPRERGEAGLRAGWAAGDYAGGAIRVSYTLKPQDDKKFRFDDTYASWRFGNWWFTVGEQQRWWGPGWDGSLVLSNNARPMPSISLDRGKSEPFKSKWLSWIGPWRLTTYMGRDQYHDAEFPRPLFWGMRVSARPLRDLEIGLSRTAQWCHVGVCSLHTFENVLLGKDNSGNNVSLSAQPGNQELTWDFRWRMGAWPAAFYFQENGETADARYPLLPRPRQTTDLAGIEIWSQGEGTRGWRGFVEVAGTTCGEFSFSKSDQPNFNCAYNNTLIYWGYYYRDRVIGDSLQGDGRLLTVGGLFNDGRARTWELRIRRGTLNRGSASVLNTLSPVAADLWNVETKLDGHWQKFVYSLGVGADRLSPDQGRPKTSGRIFLSLSAPWQ